MRNGAALREFLGGHSSDRLWTSETFTDVSHPNVPEYGIIGDVNAVVAESRPEFPTLAVKVVGDPLDPEDRATFIKPTELVDAVEITPLNRSELILYNQLIAHAWNAIAPGKVYSVAKSRLRGSHDSNDRLHEAFDRLMAGFAKVKVRDPVTGSGKLTQAAT